MGSLVTRLWQWIGAWMVRGGASAGKNVAIGAQKQASAYFNQGRAWLQGTRLYRQSRVAYNQTKKKLMSNPAKAAAITTGLGFNVALLFYFDEIIAAGKRFLGEDEYKKGAEVLERVRYGTLYQEFSATLAQELIRMGIREDEIVSSLKVAEEAISSRNEIFASLKRQAPSGTTALQLLMAYELLAPVEFSDVLSNMSEADKIGPGTAAILSALSGLSAQLEAFDNSEVIDVESEDVTLLPAPATSITSTTNLRSKIENVSNAIQSVNSDAGCVANLSELASLVAMLENMLGIGGRSASGEPNLAIFLTILPKISAEDVRKVYEVRNAVNR